METWRNPCSPDWWHDKFPHTYTEFKPMTDAFETTVYFKMNGKNMRFDFKHQTEELETWAGQTQTPWEELFRDIAMKMILEFIDLGDLTTPPLIGYGHLVWDDKWCPQVDKGTAV